MDIIKLTSEDLMKPCHFYWIRFFTKDGKEFDKVGITSRGIDLRFKKFNINYEVILDHVSTVEDCIKMEDHVLNKLKDLKEYCKIRYLKEMGLSGWSECFRTGIDIDVNETLSQIKNQKWRGNV